MAGPPGTDGLIGWGGVQTLGFRASPGLRELGNCGDPQGTRRGVRGGGGRCDALAGTEGSGWHGGGRGGLRWNLAGSAAPGSRVPSDRRPSWGLLWAWLCAVPPPGCRRGLFPGLRALGPAAPLLLGSELAKGLSTSGLPATEQQERARCCAPGTAESYGSCGVTDGVSTPGRPGARSGPTQRSHLRGLRAGTQLTTGRGSRCWGG